MPHDGSRRDKGDRVMSEQVATSATTREMQVTAQAGVIYKTPDLGGARYVVTPHPPTPRDGEESAD
jgi:hypothetical protein